MAVGKGARRALCSLTPPLLCLICFLGTLLSFPLVAPPAPPAPAPGPAPSAASPAAPAPAASAPLLLASAHCPRTDWRTAPVVAPEAWGRSRVHRGQALLDFALALPPPSVSFVSEAFATAPGMWAPIKTMVFLHVLGSPRVRQSTRLVVDVGANLGYFSQLALALGFEVAAFEPQLRAQPYLAATAARNGNGARFHLHACAVGSVRGRVGMEASDRWETAQPASVAPLTAALLDTAAAAQGDSAAAATTTTAAAATVPMALLSDVLRPGVPIALLKVNAEGFERGVLAGLTRSLLRGVRNVLVEVQATETRMHLRSLLGRAGFHCRQLQERYFVQNSSGGSVGGFQDTQMTRHALGQVLAGFLVACTDQNSEDYWFTREDWPWLCDTVGCDGGVEEESGEEGEGAEAVA